VKLWGRSRIQLALSAVRSSNVRFESSACPHHPQKLKSVASRTPKRPNLSRKVATSLRLLCRSLRQLGAGGGP